MRKPRAGDVDRLHLPEGPLEGLHQARHRRRRDRRSRCTNRQVYINGKPWDDPARHLGDAASVRAAATRDNYGPVTVPPDHVFVMGDNRDHSYDRRSGGRCRIADVKGKALVIYWSWDGPDRWVRWERLGRLVD